MKDSKPIATNPNPVTFTLVISDTPVQKTFHADGTKTSAANISTGKFQTRYFDKPLSVLPKILGLMGPNNALLTGVFPVDRGNLVTKACEDIAAGAYARTKQNVDYPVVGRYLVLLDNDPHDKGRCFSSAAEYMDYLNQLHPLFEELDIFIKPSSSAGIEINGSPRSKADGWHAFISVDAGVSVRSLRDFVEKVTWHKGDGYIALSKAARMLERCTFDLAVFSPERLIFTADPILEKDVTRKVLAQAYQQGRSVNATDDLSIAFDLEKAKQKAKADTGLLAEKDAAEALYIDDQTDKLVASTGMDAVEARVKVVDSLLNQAGYHVLPMDMEITKADGTVVTLEKLYAIGQDTVIADPFEGAEYGRTTAKYYHNNGQPIINSQAHGGSMYRLQDISYTNKAFYDQYVMTAEGKYMSLDRPLTEPMVKAAFDNRYFHEACLYNDDGSMIAIPSHFARGLMRNVDIVGYNPMNHRRFFVDTIEGCEYNTFNQYRRAVHVPLNVETDEAEKRICKHLAHLFEYEKDQRYMLDWMAHIVQRPGELIQFAPMIIGIQGDGKTTISDIITAAIGDTNSSIIDANNIKSDFNAWGEGNVLQTIEEVFAEGSDRMKIYTNLKPNITNDRLPITGKGKDSVTRVNYTNYMALSNHVDALPLTEDDRRWWVMYTKFIDSPFDGDAYAAYFKDLVLWRKSAEGKARIHQFLMNHPISDEFSLMKRAPMTESKRKMIASNMDEGTIALKERLDYFGSSIEMQYNGQTCIDVTLMNTKDKQTSHVWLSGDLPRTKSLEPSMNLLGFKKVDLPNNRLKGKYTSLYTER